MSYKPKKITYIFDVFILFLFSSTITSKCWCRVNTKKHLKIESTHFKFLLNLIATIFTKVTTFSRLIIVSRIKNYRLNCLMIVIEKFWHFRKKYLPNCMTNRHVLFTKESYGIEYYGRFACVNFDRITAIFCSFRGYYTLTTFSLTQV